MGYGACGYYILCLAYLRLTLIFRPTGRVQVLLKGGDMKNPLDSLTTTVIAGLVLTVIMVGLVMAIANGGA